ncbi:MAG: ATP-dependent DNA helicase RecQ [Kofleriaceae bacterium]
MATSKRTKAGDAGLTKGDQAPTKPRARKPKAAEAPALEASLPAAVARETSPPAPEPAAPPAKAPAKSPRRAAKAAPGEPAVPGGAAAAVTATGPQAQSPAAVEAEPAPAAAAPPAPLGHAAATAPATVDGLLDLGRAVLGITSYRAGQREALEHILAGRDVIAVMPTGSGKSLLYQLPSLVLPGLTVVVSPLIALIKDQVDKMVAKGVAVVRIDSTLTVRQRREMDALAQAPGGKLLLTTPERMADPEFRVFLRTCAGAAGVSRFVVDEAHCVSQWGHDFRPAYLSLRKALEDVGRPPVLATTATAPPHVRMDIVEQLGIDDAAVVTTTFDRPNLHYEVITFPGEDDKVKTLVTLLKKLPRPGIVYCATVKKVEELHAALARHGIPVAKYHGRMTKTERDSEQERFMAAKDLVMLATNAFGLGVDKKDIRNVLHYHVPGSLEAYAQEAGRGGRDGKPTRCVLLFSPDDVAIQEYFLSGTYPTRRQVRAVYDSLCAYAARRDGDTPATAANIALGASVGAQRTRTVLSLLKDEGFIVEQDEGIYGLADPPLPEERLMEKARQYEGRRIADRRRLDALLLYVKVPGCRNQAILDYLGEPRRRPAAGADNCLRSRDAALAAASEAGVLGAQVTRRCSTRSSGGSKPKKLVKHRVVRIDQPAGGRHGHPTSAGLGRAGPARPAPAPRCAGGLTPAAAAIAAPAAALRRRPGLPRLPCGGAQLSRPRRWRRWTGRARGAHGRRTDPGAVRRTTGAHTGARPTRATVEDEDDDLDDLDEDEDDLDDDDDLEDDDDLDDDDLDDDDEDDDLDDDDWTGGGDDATMMTWTTTTTTMTMTMTTMTTR